MKILLFEPQSDEQLAKNTMVATVNYRNLQAAQEALMVDYERALLKKLKVARQETKRLTPFEREYIRLAGGIQALTKTHGKINL